MFQNVNVGFSSFRGAGRGTTCFGTAISAGASFSTILFFLPLFALSRLSSATSSLSSASFGIGEAPFGLQGTFSLWESSTALRDFAFRGKAHAQAIADTEKFKWYSEELFARFDVVEIRGFL